MTLLQRVLAIFKSRTEEKEPALIQTNTVCPKCKGANFDVLEAQEGGGRIFVIVGGAFDLEDSYVLPGTPIRLEATCNRFECQHTWTIRNKQNINQISKPSVSENQFPKHSKDLQT